ncbi:MAG: DUF6587 family protein [Steroidobacteraceae bacterium]
MSHVLDNLLVAAALLASAVYALFALGPRAWRRRALARAAGWAGRAPAWLGLRGLAARMDAAAAKSSGGCGGCGDCGSESSPAAGAPASARPGGGDIKIPLASIGRRR